MIDGLAKASTIEVAVETKPGTANPNDVAVIAGSRAKLTEATGWAAEMGLDQSLAAMLQERRDRLARP